MRRSAFAQGSCVALLTAACTACTQNSEPSGGAEQLARAALELGALRDLASPAGAGSAEPHLAPGPNGTLVLSWVERDGEEFVLTYAQLREGKWSAPVGAARGADWVVSAADVPAIEHVTAQVWAAHWRVAAAGGPHAYDIAISVSADAGATWSAPRLLNDDGTATEHGFVSLFAWNGDVGAVWLDGRDLAGEFEDPESAAAAATTLRYARLGPDAGILEQGVIDELVCDCCTTGIARGAGGELLVYRDRTPEEIRDIAVRRRTAAGWSEPVMLGPDGWEIEGCPVNGPAIDADGTCRGRGLVHRAGRSAARAARVLGRCGRRPSSRRSTSTPTGRSGTSTSRSPTLTRPS